ncbi:hypothetical protein CNMCM6805_001901 [Aspergillus fumigatiaffinis]|uniref:Uncharacterized protein n=1 Tax=Aspergillus fumigatiaffinis TaxID=340414 RepID=A0A8H4GUD5_9EURO|nr:hypothetical protein CNMCM6805_001901 [Aspergillus fumigatiaffinis]
MGPTTLPLERFINKINEKIRLLKKGELNTEDRKVLKKGRLCFVWEESLGSSEVAVTTWRKSRARRSYKEIQEVSSHLFLAVLLVVTPTDCGKTSFESTLNYLTSLENYENYHYDLNPAAQKFFESTAAEQGFASNHHYLDFMQCLFPKRERRQIQFAYSLIRRDEIQSFLETMSQGIYSSKQWTNEEIQGGSTSGCVTIFIPTSEDEDGSCNIRVNRTLLMQAIHKFKMTKLSLA